jgi:hypothetical protein
MFLSAEYLPSILSHHWSSVYSLVFIGNFERGIPKEWISSRLREKGMLHRTLAELACAEKRTLLSQQ